MDKQGRIKKPKPEKGKRISAIDPENYDGNPPIFSLQRIQPTKYCLSKLNQEQKSAFADSIYKRREVLWKDIKKLHKHSLGIEKIPRYQIKAPIPRFIKDDVDYFLAFRFFGKSPMVGYRQKDVFFVLWFDHDFTLYGH